MSTVNKVRLIGNVGQDLEVFVTESKKNVLKFPLATNENYTNKNGEKVTKTEWHNIIMFGSRAANTAKYCKKGSRLLIDGKLQTRQYQDKQGVDKFITEIIVSDVLFLDNK